MRNLVLLLLGIVIGATGGVMTANTLSRRDAYPRGAMNVMQHQLAILRHAAQPGQCDANATAAALVSLHAQAADLEPMFYPEATPDAPFREYAQRLRDALAAASSADCSALAPGVEKIGVACDACHRQYR